MMLRQASSIFKPALTATAWPRTFSTQHAALGKGKLQFYAVRRGRTTGVFPSWEAAKAEVSGFSNAQYQGFADRESAEAYVKGDVFKGPLSTSEQLVVFCDGSFSDNAAGIGVYWGEEPGVKNLSERVPGAQKSGRAELYAIFRALQTDPDPTRPLVVYSDSEYAINALTSRLPATRAADFLGQQNKELLRQISQRMLRRPAEITGCVLNAFTMLLLIVQSQFRKVPSHSNTYGNELVDRLANEGRRKSSSTAGEDASSKDNSGVAAMMDLAKGLFH